MKTLTVIFLYWFLAIATFNSSSSCCYGKSDVICMKSEKEALLSFKQHLKDPANRLSSWDAESDCCQWDGIVCHNSTAHVRELHLRNPYDYYDHDYDYDYDYDYEAWVQQHERSKLGGKINPSLLKLKHLRYLDVSQNDFGGIPIPSFIGSLVSLRYLNLSKAGFEGTIPHQLGNLSSLRFLSLSGPPPYISGYKLDVDNLQWLSELLSLEHLHISQVSLKKAPNWLQLINMLPSLLELRLSLCDFHHTFPLSTVNFSSLAVLDLSQNNFLSSIPKWIFNLRRLVSLDISGTNFNPDAFWNLTSLKALRASWSDLNSSLPNSLFGLNGLVSLDLSSNGFEGPIPIGFQNMTSLRSLDISLNHFNSTIPNWLYSFAPLELLSLGWNELQGTISSDIENLTSAISLDLSYNELEGRVPRSIDKLCNLRQLSLWGNKLGGDVSELFQSLSGCISNGLESLSLVKNQYSGHLSDQIAIFKNLRVLSLASNSIAGPIPASLGSLSSLEYLNLDGNQLTGPIPASLGSLSSLEYLNLDRNQLTGTLPESLGHLSKLEQLDISDNLLEGAVSEVHLANLTRLIYLEASGNKLTLKVSPNWNPPFQLVTIGLRSWHLGKQFPMWLRSQKDLRSVDLSQTGISDNIPNWFWNLTSQREYLNISHNQIQGEIPDLRDTSFQAGFSLIYMSSNQFSGPLPRLSSNVTELDLSNNSFSGDVSRLLCDTKDQPNRLEILHLGGNVLTGEIPDCWTMWQSLRVIKLGNNNLTGKIPRSMGLLPRLMSLHLRNNHLSGEVPWSLHNCTRMITLDLGDNQFSGRIPTWLGNSLSNLMVLGLRSNRFHGHIPSQLCYLQSLQIMDLADNQLSGTIPRCFKNLTAMVLNPNSSTPLSYSSFYYGMFLENSFVVTKGREVQYNTILTLVTSMDLSDNNISGEIPEELTSLLGLRSLNLSGNHFTGTIPKKIGDMGSLESLDLSRNQLSGKIPPSMSGMTFLSYLNLSYNNLSGKIPSSTQLQLLNASNFIGNELCGPPLIENCSDAGVRPNTKNEGDHNEHEVDWFYVTMVLGFVMGFWGVFGPILFNQVWRRAYFQFLENMWYKICDISRKYF